MTRRHQQGPGGEPSGPGRAPPRDGKGVAAELRGLLARGDHRALAQRARAVLSGDGSSAVDRAAAQAALARVRPDPLLALVSAGMLLLLAAVAAATLGAR